MGSLPGKDAAVLSVSAVLSAATAPSAPGAPSALGAPSAAAARAAAHLPGLTLPPASSSSLTGVCGSDPAITCRFVWDITHSTTAADVTRVFLDGPVRAVGRIGFILLIAIVLRILAQRLIVKITTKAGERGELRSGRTASAAATTRRNPRATALGSVLSNAAAVTIFGIATAIILGDLGVNLAPVLASAGVLGIAIGFGAQNLVQDFLAGIFMLLEDQYGVGDVIAVGSDISGTVEAVSLRITRVRDINGVVWHVRNGTIQQAGNESQGWARAVVDYPVSYERDVAAARQVMAETAQAMWQEDEWHGVILEEPQVWGVQELSPTGVTIRLTARTMPRRQWEVARELRQRVKAALDLAAGGTVHVAGRLTASG
jgi:small conductance mechanosensitive channel